jgi:elongin-A
MPPATLLSMAQRGATRDISSLQDVGDISYELLRPILKKVTNPEQLRNLEIKSPHLADHTAELWQAFIARDIPQWQKKIMEPKNPKSWWKVYGKLMRGEKRAKEASEEQLMAAMKGIDKEREANQVTHIRKVLQEPTRHRALFADGRPNPHINHSNGAVRKPVLKNAKTGKEIMSALRKETSTAQKVKGLAPLREQPGKFLAQQPTSQITKAPEGMVRDHQKPQLTAAARQVAAEHVPRRAPRMFVTRPSGTDQRIDEAIRQERAEQAKKEERLRALASGKAATPLPQPSSQTRPSASSSHLNVRPTVSSPPKPKSPTPSASPAAASKSAAGEIRKPSSPSPAPPVVKKRPAPSIFMPAKKRKV